MILRTKLPMALYPDIPINVGEHRATPHQFDVLAAFYGTRGIRHAAALLGLANKSISAHLRNFKTNKETDQHKFSEDMLQYLDSCSQDTHAQLTRHYRYLLVEKAFQTLLKSLPQQEGYQSLHIQIQDLGDAEEAFPLRQLTHHLHLTHTNVTFSHNEKNYPLRYDFVLTVQKKLPTTPKVLEKEKQETPSYPYQLIVKKVSHPNDSETIEETQVIPWNVKEEYYTCFCALLPVLFPHMKISSLRDTFQQKRSDILSEVPSPKEIFSFAATGKRGFSWKKGLLLFLVIALLAVTIKKAMDSFFIENSIYADLVMPDSSARIERHQTLQKIEQTLQSQNNIGVVALVGMGGIGKTTTARLYAQKVNAKLVWELNAETEESLLNGYTDLAYALANTHRLKDEIKFIENIKDQALKKKQLMHFVRLRLKHISSWFLIYDNVKKIKDIIDYIPRNKQVWGQGQIILTSRDMTLAETNILNAQHVISVEMLSQHEAMDLFSKIFMGKEFNKITSEMQRQISTLINKIPPFPLDISLAAYFLKSNPISFEKYYQNVDKQQSDFQAYNDKEVLKFVNYHQTRAQLIKVTLDTLISKAPYYYEPLLLLSLCDSQKIPTSLLKELLPEQQLFSFLNDLKKNGLVVIQQPLIPNITFQDISLHRSTQKLMRLYFQKYCSRTQIKSILQSITEAMHHYFLNYIEGSNHDSLKIETFLPHMIASMHHIKQFGESGESFQAQLLLWITRVHRDCTHNFIQGLAHGKILLKNFFPVLSKQQQVWLLKEMGFMSEETKDLDQAITYCQKSIALAQKMEGMEPVIAANWGIMGETFAYQNKFHKAKEAYETSLSIIKNLPKHTKNLNVLASSLYKEMATLNIIYRLHYDKEKTIVYAVKALELIGANKFYHKSQTTEQRETLRKKGFLLNAVWVHLRMVTLYITFGDFQKAQEHLNEVTYLIANKMYAIEKDNYLKAFILAYQGELFLRKNELSQAEDALLKAQKLFDALVGKGFFAYGKVVLAEIYIRQHQFQKANSLCNQVLSTKLPIKNTRARLITVMTLYHQALAQLHLHDQTAATETLKRFFSKTDLLAKEVLPIEKYQLLQKKGIFTQTLTKKNNPESFAKALNKAAIFFEALYWPTHPFVKDYVIKHTNV